MTKAKTKADRVAARAAHKESKGIITNPAATSMVHPGVDVPLPMDETADNTPAEIQMNEFEEAVTVAPAVVKEQLPDRIELLRSKHEVVSRFMQLTVPVLIDVYAASVVTPVRLKTLTGLLKAVGFLEGEDLKRVFTVRSLRHTYQINTDIGNKVCSRG